MIVSPTMATGIIVLNIGIICYILFKIERTKRRNLVYFLNLALSDIVLAIVVLLVKVMVEIEGTSGDKSTLKEVRIFLQMKAVSLSLYISGLSIAAITIERLILVMYPFYYTRLRYATKRIICMFMWITSAAGILVPHFFVQNDLQEYILTPILALCIIALATISFYLIRKRLIARNELRYVTNAERVFTKYCFQSFLLFVVCWIPISIFGILFSSGVLSNWKYLLDFRYTCHVVAFLNSLLSPLLFILRFVWRKSNRTNNEMPMKMKKTDNPKFVTTAR